MVATLRSVIPLVSVFSALLVKASPVAYAHNGMSKRYDQDKARYMQDAGCYKDDVNNRIFEGRPEHNIPAEKTTVEACYEACLVSGWRAAGLQNGESSPLCLGCKAW